MSKTFSLWHLMIAACICGCSAGGVGTESDARKFVDTEFGKWIAGKENAVSTMASRTQDQSDPISYEIRSVAPDEPDFLACEDEAKMPKDWRTWPAFRFNVAIEHKSKAGTPVTKITTYNLTWNSTEGKWYASEQP